MIIAGFPGFLFGFNGHWIDGWTFVRVIVGMRVSLVRFNLHDEQFANLSFSIVEYATRDQAQNAVNTLSNQNLMGRLVYVREVSLPSTHHLHVHSRHSLTYRSSTGPRVRAALL